ncbi:hypothetical protein CKO15_08735 [Halorhodospira abdelmalekii]|uniref:twin-arginine translocase TatA/TatE family subunit n=1 Tax=Halorhodospira abdelmalekii TaxID=421629 RepID=UPI001907194B|nr:twin-arginine translocase TatA/TatE family subunit [Halorhodospira abdelmalekii]MBK1735366.1 hypothetical protein [Halorhodospira abdelmalekii]
MGVSIWSLLIILLIVALLFGTKRLRNIGGDLGSAIRGFKESVQAGEREEQDQESGRSGEPGTLEHQQRRSGETIEGEAAEARQHANPSVASDGDADTTARQADRSDR